MRVCVCVHVCACVCECAWLGRCAHTGWGMVVSRGRIAPSLLSRSLAVLPSLPPASPNVRLTNVTPNVRLTSRHGLSRLSRIRETWAWRDRLAVKNASTAAAATAAPAVVASTA